MADIVQFVDKIDPSPAVRLDLNNAASGLAVAAAGIDLSPPPVRRATAATMMTEGEQIMGSVPGNRTLKIPILTSGTTPSAAASALANLGRELSRPRNTLRLQLDGMSSPVFFRTFAAPDYELAMAFGLLAKLTQATLSIPAEPYALGLPVVIGQTDPPENANPYFESNVDNWTATFGTVARSTVRAHEGVGSMLVTPSGAGNTHVDSEKIGDGSSIAGWGFRVSGWFYSTAGYVAGVGPRANFYTDAGDYIESQGATTAIPAGVWTYYESPTLFAPAGAVRRQVLAAYAGTPAAGDTLWVDQLMIGGTGEYQMPNDPATPVTVGTSKLSANDAGVETSLGGWTAPDADQTVVRSTAQAHSGSASILVTAANTNTSEAKLSPYAGVSTSDHACNPNLPHVVTVWGRAGATGRTVVARVAWYTSANLFIGFSDIAGSDAAGSWTRVTGVVWSPPTAAKYELYGQVLTPAAAEQHFFDDWSFVEGTPGIMVDLTGVEGDTETPAKIEVSGGGSDMALVLGVRRHGTPANITPVVQCESMVQGADTTPGTGSGMSNGQRARCTFATTATMVTRLTGTFPASGGQPWPDRRGVYRMFLLVASSASGSTYGIRMKVDAQYGGGTLLTGDTVIFTAADTARHPIDLGLIQIPLGQDPVYDGYGAEKEVSAVAVQFQAQRTAGAGSLDMDYAAAVFGDEEQCQLGTAHTTGGSFDLVLDGVNRRTWVPWPSAVGEIHAYGSTSVPKSGDIPMLTPGQTNRIMVLRPDAIGTQIVRGPDTLTRRTVLRFTYCPRYKAWAP